MIKTLYHLLRHGRATPREWFPDLPDHARGLPCLTASPCGGCGACQAACPTAAVRVESAGGAALGGTAGVVELDLGRCLACGDCVAACPSGTLATRRDTRVATRTRRELVTCSEPDGRADAAGGERGASSGAGRIPDASPDPDPTRMPGGAAAAMFLRSLHIREVSTGDNASDLEVAAAGNPVFDMGRFGVHVVASPRHADALVVTGPVALAMQEPLRRCHDAMAEPRLVIAVGAAAISGSPWEGGYAGADGVEAVLPVSAYVPGSPPHPWYVIHGLLLAMGHPGASS